MSDVDAYEKQLVSLLRTAGEVLQDEGYITLSEQIDALLINYGFEGIPKARNS